MCSPFAYRTYHKPLGYAGDYEMVNMIARDPYEGGSLFAKAVNLWFLSQWPARAHRNRITLLKVLLVTKACGRSRGRPLRVLNLGCGPAREIQEFLAENALVRPRPFHSAGFQRRNHPAHHRVLGELKHRFGRITGIQVQKKSVQQVLKDGAKPRGPGAEPHYDLIYCAGLFDYLPDRTCMHLMNVFYGWLAPGGLLVATNVDDCKPFRHMLEFVLDWHLIYRGVKKSAALLPERAAAESARILKDPTEVNVFIEVRKPEHG